MSLYLRGKSWCYDFVYRGERYRGCLGPITKTLAKEMLARKKAEAAEGRYKATKKPSPLLKDFVEEEYFPYYQANRRPHSVRRYVIAWKAMQPVFGQKRLPDISPFDLERYRRDRKQSGRSDVTVNRELTFLRHVYSMAITWGKASENPVKKVRFAREDNGRIRMLSAEEEQRLLVHCGPQITPLVIAALHTGFRASELLSLTWADVDFKRRMITVRAGYSKNGESRAVPMNQCLTETLKAVRMTAQATAHVFCNQDGMPYRSFRSAFERAVRKAGLDDFTFHDLRHTFASRLVMHGVDLPTVKELLGHKTIAMTLRYTHVSSDHKQRAVSMLEQRGELSPHNFHHTSQQLARRDRATA